MTITKCVNNHYYDAEKYDVCPHCGALPVGSKEPKKAEVVSEKKEYKSFWPKKKKSSNEVEIIAVTDETVAGTVGVFGQVDEADNQGVVEEPKKEEVFKQKESKKAEEVTPPTPIVAEAPTPIFVAPPTPVVEEPPKENDLLAQVKKVTSDDSDKTVGYFAMKESEATAPPKKSASLGMVVGWLVCIQGSHLGESFNIYAGRNAIGRQSSNHIVIPNDNAISREKHLWIIYEPKKRKFFVQQGEGTGLAYLNDEPIMSTSPVQMKDCIEIGQSKFLLIPLCDEEFSWEQYIIN